MTLGQKIKKLRNDKMLTQKDLADTLHVTFQTVSKWESDINEPDISTLKELAKIFNCSVDELISDQEVKELIEEQKEEPKEAVVPVSHNGYEHVCAYCGKDIPEEDLVSVDQFKKTRHGRTTRSTNIGQVYYHKECLEQLNIEKAKEDLNKKEAYSTKAAGASFGWAIFGGVVALIIALVVFFTNQNLAKMFHPVVTVLISIGISYGIFAMIYCIISGSFIGDIFTWCASRTIKLPALIFSWSFEGVAWLIWMKVLFAIIGFIFGLMMLGVGITLSAGLGILAFPFVLANNIKTGYEGSIIPE